MRSPWIALALGALGAACFVMAFVLSARAADPWEASPADVRQWYRGLMQPDNPAMSCCGEADAYWADSFEVVNGQTVLILTDDRVIPGRQERAPGTRIVVPDHKLKIDRGNPTGHGVIFLRPGTDDVYCAVMPGGV